jgi:8-oxo-dGTP pyrophosphatase MutT (NUDIX family)
MTPELQVTQAAAVPFRIRDGAAECCLITSSSQPVIWTIPKGTIEPGDTPETTAIKEAEEEAGLVGRIPGNSLGTFTYQKNGNTRRVTVFVMEVDEILDHWDEAHVRKRQWVSSEEVLQVLAAHPVLPILKKAMTIAENVALMRGFFGQT